MAISFDCSHCQAHFSVADSLAGRKAKCTRCGQAIQIPAPAVRLDDDGLIALADEPEAEARHTVAPPPPPFPTAAGGRKGKAKGTRPKPARPPPPAPQGQFISAPAHPVQQAVVLDHAPPPGLVLRDDGTYGISRGFWPDLGHSFIYVARGRGPFIFIMMVLMVVARSILGIIPVPIFPAAGRLLLTGLLFAYYFEIVGETCRGEDELPSFGGGSGFLDDVVFPFFKYVATYAWVLLPAIAWWISLIYRGRVEMLVIPTEAVDIWILGGLVLLGVFLWPMTALSVAINGFTLDVVRYDLQLITIARAPLGYLAIWLLLVAANAIMVASALALQLAAAVLGGGLALAMGAILLTAIAAAYATVVSMRAIGLFYRHYKDRFAWAAE